MHYKKGEKMEGKKPRRIGSFSGLLLLLKYGMTSARFKWRNLSEEKIKSTRNTRLRGLGLRKKCLFGPTIADSYHSSTFGIV